MYGAGRGSLHPAPLPITVNPAPLVPVCPVLVPSPPVSAIDPESTLTINSIAIAPCSMSVVRDLISDAPLAHTPASPPLIPVHLAPKPTPSTSPPHPWYYTIPTVTPPIPADVPVVIPPDSIVHEHRELFRRYERRMDAAKTEGGRLKVPSIPWPVLNAQFPLALSDPSLSSPLFRPTCEISSPRTRGGRGCRSNKQA
jgi:hypothetical protein